MRSRKEPPKISRAKGADARMLKRPPVGVVWKYICHVRRTPVFMKKPEMCSYAMLLRFEVIYSRHYRVQYFVRGGSVGHRSRASSKHLSPHLPVDELDSSGGQTGLRCTCRCTCGCRVHKESRLDVDVFEK
ncbi:hypothetical protein TNCV_3446171 [Trichonephila clavipes]|nr:hypothetical protein TNCV_3446171 [Trichonephila clavipes]